MKKRSFAFMALVLIITGLLISPVTAAPVEGYPYNDNEKYSYFMEQEEGFSQHYFEYNKEKLPEDAYYHYFIRVRDAKMINRILSYDKLELLFPGLPAHLGYTEEITKYEIPILSIIKDDKPDMIRKELDIKHYHRINFELRNEASTWQHFVSEVRSRDRTKMGDLETISISETSYMGYKALVVDIKNTNYSKETDTALSAIDIQNIFIYMEDAVIPNGILVANITTEIAAHGEYYVFSSYVNNNFSEAEFKKYANEMKDQIRKQMTAEKDNRDSILGLMSAIKPKVTKTVDMQVPYKGPAVKTPVKNVEIDTNASKTEGEVAVSVPAVIAVGVASAAAALAAAGAAGADGSDSGDNSENDPKGTFSMVIGKNFGDAIKLGKKVQVSARITELKEGIPIDRPDLTEQISIFSNEILVGAVSVQGNNLTAELQIQENAPPQGILSFHYNGPLAYFQNNVKFRLIEKGQIKLACQKVSILSTDAKPFELVYELIDFLEEEPPLEITASSGFVKLDIGKNDINQPVLLISPGSDAEQWDHSSFTKECTCEISALDGKLPIRASFKVTVCFEGIGTAFEHLKINEIEKDSLIECYTEAEKEKREKNALWLPLTVMCWDDKKRMLEPDTGKANNLVFAFRVDPDFEFLSPQSKKLAEKVVIGANLTAQPQPAPDTLRSDKTKKPAAYRVMTTNDPGEGAAPFDTEMIVTCDSDSALTPLKLKAQLKPNPDFRGMVIWFLEYPLKGSIGKQITLGNIQTYLAALEFIENRVYPISGVPWASNMTWLATRDSHFEPGDGNPLRKSYIAIQDSKFPKGIGSDEFIRVQTLVHELTHVIEHQNGDTRVTIYSERHAYYLQYMSDLTRHLTDIENPSCNQKREAQWAIQAFYKMYTDPEITSDLSRINSWFGAKLDLTTHQLFDLYAYHADTILSSTIPQAQKDAISALFRSLYFPGNLYGGSMDIGGKAFGYYVETDGPFKDAQWKFNWNMGSLLDVELTYRDYTFDISSYRWVGGDAMTLQVNTVLKEKNTKADPDNLLIAVNCGAYSMSGKFFPDVPSFKTKWKTLNQSYNSILYAKTGFTEEGSWAERKK